MQATVREPDLSHKKGEPQAHFPPGVPVFAFWKVTLAECYFSTNTASIGFVPEIRARDSVGTVPQLKMPPCSM
jgi:hypothetical protein